VPRHQIKLCRGSYIVLILTDDQRLDNSEQPGDTTVSHMPIVQRQLVDKGVTFTNGFDVNPLCCPSRSTILTGMDSGHTGVWANTGQYGGFSAFTNDGDDRSTIATWLHDAGYETGFVGKYLNGYGTSDVSYVPPGWDTWNALALGDFAPGYYDYSMSVNGDLVSYGSTDADYSTHVLSRDATDFIAGVPSGQPLFLYFALRAPHSPATPEAKYQKGCPGLPLNRPPSWNEADVSDKPPYIQARPLVNRDGFNRRQCRALLSVDDAVGNVLSALSAAGRLRNTLVLYASDNGLANGEHRWKAKTVPYEESIRVRVIARYGAVQGQVPRTESDLVLNMDFAPTFADAAGVPVPSATQGTSFLPQIEGTNPSSRTIFLLEHGGVTGNVPAYCGVRTTRFAYVRYSDGFEELYNLNSDPFELQNVASDPSLATRKAALLAQTVRMCSPTPPGYHF
jgi:N-acetylglucosamine-6-sulfatase